MATTTTSTMAALGDVLRLLTALVYTIQSTASIKLPSDLGQGESCSPSGVVGVVVGGGGGGALQGGAAACLLPWPVCLPGCRRLPLPLHLPQVCRRQGLIAACILLCSLLIIITITQPAYQLRQLVPGFDVKSLFIMLLDSPT